MLNESERALVRAAVDKAEAGLAAEIVPCVFAQSSPYPETTWAGAAAAVALACGAMFLTDLVHPLWQPLSTLILFVPAAGLLGAALGRWCGPVKRFLIGPHRMEASTHRRAKEVFYDRGIDRAKARDGVLIFASLLERRVVVLADEAVRGKVPAGAWQPAIAAMTVAAGHGRVADGLAAAVEKAGAALRAAGVVGKGGGELGDDAVEGDGR
ncbi:MAG TPA: TPM domain-containing protein [Elusimicrobiota bacterium]|nr:TPM domain-containing protein [Elusimicrobiota bacterium]